MYENVSALAASCCIFPRQYHTLSHEMHQTHEIKVQQVVPQLFVVQFIFSFK